MDGSSRSGEFRTPPTNAQFFTWLLIATFVIGLIVAVQRVGLDRILDALLPTVAEGAIPPREVKLVYEGGSQLEDKIREAKREISQQLSEAGCLVVQLAIWRDGDDITIAATCLEWRR